jgi:hypothetical protein
MGLSVKQPFFLSANTLQAQVSETYAEDHLSFLDNTFTSAGFCAFLAPMQKGGPLRMIEFMLRLGGDADAALELS